MLNATPELYASRSWNSPRSTVESASRASDAALAARSIAATVAGREHDHGPTRPRPRRGLALRPLVTWPGFRRHRRPPPAWLLVRAAAGGRGRRARRWR